MIESPEAYDRAVDRFLRVSARYLAGKVRRPLDRECAAAYRHIAVTDPSQDALKMAHVNKQETANGEET